MMADKHGIRLEKAEGCAKPMSHADANVVLADWGVRIVPLELHSIPGEIRKLLRQACLTEAEAERIKTYFLLPRERLVEIITAARENSHVPGGGELNTYDATHGYYYPQLWVVQQDLDYSRFDRFHVNLSDDGTAVDEVIQMLAGSGLVIRHQSPNHGVVTLYLDCPEGDAGWIVTYSGGDPHIGSVSRAAPGTKLLVQVIGPATWTMKYEDED